MTASKGVNTIRITVAISPPTPWLADLLTAELAGQGFDTFVETPDGFEAYAPENLVEETALTPLFEAWRRTHDIIVTREVVPAQNWNEVWEKNYFQPLVIRDRVVVRAPFHTEYPPCPIEIVIEPKMAFGTGNHETTSLMMELMLALPMQGWHVLDMGCGTGILAILAARLGAARITAIDNDPWSFQATSENILLNQTPEVIPLLGDASLLPISPRPGKKKQPLKASPPANPHPANPQEGMKAFPPEPWGTAEAMVPADPLPAETEGTENTETPAEGYHLVVANIQKNVIISDLRKYEAVLRPGGHLLVSGFFTGDLPAVTQQAASLGLLPETSLEKNNWTAASFRKKGIFVVT